MRAWAGSMMGTMMWRKIFADHPALLEVFAPGNEEMLATGRQQHDKLEQAIQKFGMPPQALMDELLHGGNNQSSGTAAAESSTVTQPTPGSIMRGIFGGGGGGGGRGNGHLTSGRMEFIDSFALNDEDYQNFFAHGYIRVNNAVPEESVENALRHINSCIARNELNRSIPSLLGLNESNSNSSYLIDLFDSNKLSKIPTIVQCLLGKGKVFPPISCQVALKFPSPMNAIPKIFNNKNDASIREDGWHIDGFGQGKHSPFTLLINICLSDINNNKSGEFAIHPGQHWNLQEEIKKQVHSNQEVPNFSNFENGNDGNKPKLGPPLSMLLKKGDVVICHQKLPHLGMPNFSPNIRYQVYFRVSHIQLSTHREAWLDDMMLPFDGLKSAMSL